jgi:hypothetical protein
VQLGVAYVKNGTVHVSRREAVRVSSAEAISEVSMAARLCALRGVADREREDEFSAEGRGVDRDAGWA